MEIRKRVESIKKFDFEGRRIPGHMAYGLAYYIEYGQEQGHFLTAVLEGSIVRACYHADGSNLWVLPVYAAYLYNHAPLGCWGSKEKVKKWIEYGGLHGKIDAAEKDRAERLTAG